MEALHPLSDENIDTTLQEPWLRRKEEGFCAASISVSGKLSSVVNVSGKATLFIEF